MTKRRTTIRPALASAPPPRAPFLSRLAVAPAVVAFAAAALVLAQIDPAGDYPAAPQGPGVTIDESFNVQQGVWLAVAGKAWLYGAASWRDVFGGNYLPDHPPLGRLWLGVAHQFVTTIVPPRDHPGLFVTAAARCGSAIAFAVTVFLVGWTAQRWHGRTAGIVAAVSLVLMPRVFGHAHLASLETCMGLAYAGTVIALAVSWAGSDPPPSRTALWTGVVFGLALLTKVQAILLPVPVAVWAIGRWRLRGVRPLALWGIAGLATMFALWPWLWLDPVGHFQQYLGRTTDRALLGVWYLGQRFADRDVPWHYPWVMFLVTVPVGLQALGFWGAVRSIRSRRLLDDNAKKAPETAPSSETSAGERLALACLLMPLIVFSVPGVAVYDGERLFLVVFPLWALFIGGGAAAFEGEGSGGFNARYGPPGAIQQVLSNRTTNPAARSRWRFALLPAFVLLQGIGLSLSAPCWLSQYNLLVGGLGGADRLGFERSYWGDSVTRGLLDQLAEAAPDWATVDVAPVMHQFQLDDLRDQAPMIRRKKILLKAWSADRPSEWILVYDRLADLPAELREPPAGMTTAAEVRRDGVRLAAVYRRDK